MTDRRLTDDELRRLILAPKVEVTETIQALLLRSELARARASELALLGLIREYAEAHPHDVYLDNVEDPDRYAAAHAALLAAVKP